MRRIFSNNLSGYLSVWMAVLLVFVSSATAQQQVEKKPIIGAFGSALLGGAIGGGAVFAIFAAMGEHPYGFLLLPIGTIPGSTLGIWLYDKENCSVGSTVMGALLPTVVFAVVGWKIGAGMDEARLGIGYGSCIGGLTAPLGTTIGYSLGRRRQSSTTGSLLNIERNALRIGIPSPTFRAILSSRDKVSWEYQINLVSARF